MLSWLQPAAEQAELRVLNARLSEYVGRVRELEREHRALEAALRSRRGWERANAEAEARAAEEARGLRAQLELLGRAAAQAEGERDALRRELRELQRLGAEAAAARGRLQAELGAGERELREALGARAALEALLGRLQAERRALDANHARELRELRARAAAGLTVRYRARAAGPAAPPPQLREALDGYAALAAEARRETARLYEEEVRGLEAALRRGEESRRGAEEEARRGAQEAEALRRRALELDQLRARLEDELRGMREDIGMQVTEWQRVLESLEDEKEALTLAMAARLRDYQELLQVKTGLSLEVATYRALLEGESNPEIVVWTEEVESMPQEWRNTSYRYADSILQRKNERNLLARQKPPVAAVNHSLALYSNESGHLESQIATSAGSAARRGFPGPPYSSSAATRQENHYEKTVTSRTNFQTFSPAPGLVRNAETPVKTFPDRPRPDAARDTPAYAAREPRGGHQDHVGAGAAGSTWANERTVVWGKKVESKDTREREGGRAGDIRAKPREKMFDSKEKASEERNLRWEELTKLDKEARVRESQPARDEARARERGVKEKEVPIRLEAPRGSGPEGAPRRLPTPGEEGSGEGQGREAAPRETRFRLDAGDASSSLQGDAVTKTIAENIVTTILQQFTQAPGAPAAADAFPDTKVTYVDRKELPGDRKTQTEIVVESRLTEDVDVSDDAGLDYLLSKEVRDVGLKGQSAERVIGDMVNLGLKGREGRARVVSVEIVEEPVSYAGAARAEEFTPFQVEEEEEGEGEGQVTASAHRHQRATPPLGSTTHVEEVAEAGDSEGEQGYFVSTPEERAGGQDGEEQGSVYGQIHIEEAATIRYSWQDEIVQGTWRRRPRPGAEGEAAAEALEVPAPTLGVDARSAGWKEEASGEVHAEPTVIEKEIRIPQDLHASLRGTFSREPRHQLAEVIGQLEGTLPERVKEELAALTREEEDEPGGISVDVKKVQTSGGGAVTLVAEVNLSKTVDADKLDLEELSRDDAGEIEKAVESVVRESLTKRPGRTPGTPDGDDGAEVPAGSFRFKRWATRELYSPSGERDDGGQASGSSEQLYTQGPVSATVEVTSPRAFVQSHVLEDVNRAVRHIKLGPMEVWRTEEVSSGGPTAEVGEVDVSNARMSASWVRVAGTEAEAHGESEHGGWTAASTGKDWAAGDGPPAHGEKGVEQASFDRAVQLQRMVDQRSVVSDEKKVALLYLDEEEEGDGHWF